MVRLGLLLLLMMSVCPQPMAAEDDEIHQKVAEFSRAWVAEGLQVAGFDQVQRPAREKGFPPDYPERALADGVTGFVILKVLVAASGKVKSAEAVHCDRPGHGFEAAAEQAVRKWRYEPPKRIGRAVEAWLAQPIAFRPASPPPRPPSPAEVVSRVCPEGVLKLTGQPAPDLPKLVQKTDPIYPDLARRAAIAGQVVLVGRIQADGKVSAVEALACTAPHLGFEEAAKEAIQHWVYQPFLVQGTPVEICFFVSINYSMDSGAQVSYPSPAQLMDPPR